VKVIFIFAFLLLIPRTESGVNAQKRLGLKNVEAKSCFSERVRHIYFCLLRTVSTIVDWKGREKEVVDRGFGT
jgi:hypothetical protein